MAQIYASPGHQSHTFPLHAIDTKVFRMLCRHACTKDISHMAAEIAIDESSTFRWCYKASVPVLTARGICKGCYLTAISPFR